MDACPYRSRFEHRDSNLPPPIVRVALWDDAAVQLLRSEAFRLSINGAAGIVELIDQAAEPDVVVERCAIGPRTDSGGATQP